MQNITDLIREIPVTEEEEPEDIFASAPGFLFTDDLRVEHGDPGSLIIYKSKRFGELELRTADPTGEAERHLFSHYLWNAGVLMAERVSGERMVDDAEIQQWNVEGQSVLELGAGVGLAGIASTLAGAKEVVISDYPTKAILDNLRLNVNHNVSGELTSTVKVEGHQWGILDTEFAAQHKNHFSRLLAADCFWMPGVHEELTQSMLHFLSEDTEARIYAIGGFHTGRAKLAAFFDVAEQEGLEVEEIFEEDCEGHRRPWVKFKDGGRENTTERKRWMVIAVLKRAEA